MRSYAHRVDGMLRTRDKTCARRCRFGHPARNNETRHSAVFAESRRDKTSLSGRLHRLSKRCSYAPASFEVARIMARAGGVVSSGWHTPDRNLSLREIFPEVPGAAQRVVAPREGPHALISSNVRARTPKPGRLRGRSRPGGKGGKTGKTRVYVYVFSHYVELFPLCSQFVPTLFPLMTAR